MGLASNYCAPVIYLSEELHKKNSILLLRLDQYDFTNFKENNFTSKINKGIISKKFGEPNFIIPFTDQYFKSINEHVISLAKENLNWIKHHPKAIEDLINLKKDHKYTEVDNIDLDASLYQEDFFSNDDYQLMNSFHAKTLLDKVSYINTMPEGRIKEFAIRIMGRNYFSSLSDALSNYYNQYLNSILHKQSEKPDFKGELRNDPVALLNETKDLLKKKEFNEQDLNILNSLKDLISLKIRKQQDLGF